MIIFGFILYILLAVVLSISAFLFVSPALIGIAIIVIGNIVSMTKRGKAASILWDVLTVVVTIFSTILLWKDIMSDAVDFGALPFIILFIYGLGSLVGFGIPMAMAIPKVIKEQKERKLHREIIPWEALSEKIQKRIRRSRVVAIACLVMTALGTIIIATGSAAISEALPPTIIFAIISIICWAIAGKKYYRDSTDSTYKQVPDEFSRVVNAEYREFFHEEPPEGYAQAMFDDYENWDDDLKSTMKGYVVSDCDVIHTYCCIAFDDSGRTCYYRTKDIELEVGDAVYVPWGNKAPKRIGIIVSIEDFDEEDVPFPLEKTRFIISKV